MHRAKRIAYLKVLLAFAYANLTDTIAPGRYLIPGFLSSNQSPSVIGLSIHSPTSWLKVLSVLSLFHAGVIKKPATAQVYRSKPSPLGTFSAV